MRIKKDAKIDNHLRVFQPAHAQDIVFSHTTS